MKLSKTESFLFKAGSALAFDYATHTAAMYYLNMPARTVAAYTLGIATGTYYAGMTLSYMINEEQGVEDYRYAVDTIVTGEDGGMTGRIHDSIFNVSMYAAPIVDEFIDDVQMGAKAIYMQGKHLARRMIPEQNFNPLLMPF
jgi:hypothetical protein